MSVSIDGFEGAFEPVILQRAKGYFNSGRVGAIDYDNAPLLHALVDGSVLYDVDIRLKGKSIASVACTCPYDRSAYCKHVGAVLYKIREESNGGQANAESAKISTALYRCVRTFLEEQVASTPTQRHFRDRIRKTNPRAKPLSLGEVHKIIKAPIRSFGKRRYPSPYNNDDALQGVYQVIDAASGTRDAIHAVAEVLIAIEYSVDFLSTYDDSGGIAGDAFDALLQLLEELNEEIAANEDDALCLEIFKSIEATSQKEVCKEWLFDDSFLEVCLPLTISESVRRSFEALLNAKIQKAQEEKYPRSTHKYVKLKYLSMRLNGDVAADEYVLQHVDDPYFLNIVVQAAFLANDFMRVRDLIQKQVVLSEGSFWSFHSSELSSDVFEHGWWTYLEAVCEAEGDEAGLLDVYQTYVVAGNEASYIDRIKQKAPNWPTRRKAMIEALRDSGHTSESYEALMRKESLVREALAYCERFPSRTPALCQIFAKRYPCETKSLLLQLIADKSKQTTGRAVYQEICTIIQRYQTVFGTKEGLAIVDELIKKYPQRRAMKEELNYLRSSWD